MTMPIRAQVILENTSGRPENRVVNTWHFLIQDTLLLPNVDLMFAELVAFYNAIDVNLGAQLSGVWSIKWYSLNEPAPRTPFQVNNPPNLVVSSTALPAEVAVCLSYKAVQPSGVPSARRRGRLYIGPLSNGWLSATVTPDVRPDNTRLVALRDAAQTILDHSRTATTWDWALWSPTDTVARPIVGGYVDNAFDTQRRRGVEATNRTALV